MKRKSTACARTRKRRTKPLPPVPAVVHPEVMYSWPVVHQLVGYCDMQVRRLQAKGKFPPHIRCGTHRKWLGQDIIKWREEHRAPTPLAA